MISKILGNPGDFDFKLIKQGREDRRNLNALEDFGSAKAKIIAAAECGMTNVTFVTPDGSEVSAPVDLGTLNYIDANIETGKNRLASGETATEKTRMNAGELSGERASAWNEVAPFSDGADLDRFNERHL